MLQLLSLSNCYEWCDVIVFYVINETFLYMFDNENQLVYYLIFTFILLFIIIVIIIFILFIWFLVDNSVDLKTFIFRKKLYTQPTCSYLFFDMLIFRKIFDYLWFIFYYLSFIIFFYYLLFIIYIYFFVLYISFLILIFLNAMQQVYRSW